MSEKTMPHAERAEMSIMSVILQKPKVFIGKAKAEGISPAMFYQPKCSTLFKILLEMDEKQEEIELVALSEKLADSGILERIGGASSLGEIYSYFTNTQHWNEHVSILRDRYSRRVALLEASKVIQAASDGDSERALKSLSEGLDAVKLSCARKKSFQDAKETYEKFCEIMRERCDTEDIPGISTGIDQLDAIGGGARDGEFWVICGETSAGKSALSLQIALPAIDAGLNVLIFTLEMGSEEVFSRILSCRNTIDLGLLMSPKGMSKGEGQKIKRSAQSLAESKLKICDEPNMSIEYICAQCEQEADSRSVDLIIVDYIQILESDKRQGETREQELARSSRRLKQLAKKLKCPVISPAQLNDDGKLRESRAIGQDADVVIKITDKGIAVNKYRNAQRNDLLPLELAGKYQRFETIFNHEKR